LARTLTRPAPPDLKALARHPFVPRPQSGSRKSKKGPVTAILIGLGLIGGGAYLMATYRQPTTLVGLLDEEQPNRRAIGATLVGTGAVFTLGGLIWLARD
jgi:threonine dehydrogenase-like Zn-dependent dehydrogenase